MNQILMKEKIKQFLVEDIGERDITATNIFPDTSQGTATFYVKQSGIIAGLAVIQVVAEIIHPDLRVKVLKKDGDKVEPFEAIATIEGPIQHILTGERVILNLLQRMSGIATITNTAVNQLGDGVTRICDTRKTTPGLRMFEKYAVTCGGGFNHRNGLYDGVMIKDNHIAFCGSITQAVERVKRKLGPMVKIEVETESEAQVIEAVQAGCDIIMFDNTPPEKINAYMHHVPKHIITEASGNITMETLHTFNQTNVDFISLGILTHSPQALDISLSI